jgi:L-lactate utilization protein LutC
MSELNELLQDAQSRLNQYKAIHNSDDMDKRRALCAASNSAWKELCEEIERNLPVSFVDADNKVRTIGTIGVMESDTLLRYSEKENSEYVLRGYRMSAVKMFQTC